MESGQKIISESTENFLAKPFKDNVKMLKCLKCYLFQMHERDRANYHKIFLCRATFDDPLGLTQ